MILLGDLNGDLASVTTQIRRRGTAGIQLAAGQEAGAWDTLLYSAQDSQQERSYRDVAYNRIFIGRYELLDHGFVSQELARGYPRRIGQIAQLGFSTTTWSTCASRKGWTTKS